MAENINKDCIDKSKEQNQSNQQCNSSNEKTNDLNNQSEQNQTSQQQEKKEVVTLSQDEYNGIKLQMAKVINDYKELERDLENYRKRSKEDVENARLDGITKALEVILPSLDTFKKAKKIIKDQNSLDGVSMIEKGIVEALKKLNVNKIDCLNKKFDPNYHNAVLSIVDEKHKAGTVIEEVEAGYMFNDKVIKFSQVVVAKDKN